MNPAFVTGPLAQAIGWALLHLVWQGAVVAAVLAASLAACRNRSAHLRYALACAALATIVVLGVVTAFRSYSAGTPASHGQELGSLLAATAGQPAALAAVVAAQPDRLRGLSRAAGDALPIVVMVWLAGVALLSVRLLAQWRHARRLVIRGVTPAREAWQSSARSLSDALGVRSAVRLLESVAIEVPSVVGFLRPAILIPAGALSGLTPAQIDMILAHELAHIRRHDYLVNLLQGVVETLLFYHPAVWWISNRMRIEREHCCDDLAVAVCGDPVQYARALTRLEELRGDAPALAMSARGGSLIERVRRIIGGAPRTAEPAVRAIAALAVLGGVLIAMAAPTFSAIGEDRPSKELPHPPAVQVAIVVDPEPSSSDSGASDSDEPADLAAGESGKRDSARQEAEKTGDGNSLDIDDLIMLRVHDVTPATIHSVRTMFPQATLRDIANMSAVGATPEFVSEMRRAGLTVTSPEEAQGLAAVGVTPDAIRGLRAAGLTIQTAEEAQGLIAVGVTPEYIREMRATGLTVESTEEYQGMVAVGVTAEFVRAMRSAGLSVTTGQEAQGLAAVGVTPAYIKAMRDAGVRIADVDDAQSLKAVGVTPEFVQRLAGAGYRDLSAEELQRLAAAGVTDGFIREMSRYRTR